ncbi:MAG: 16S rRNA (guanine(966)-N(2))-methyltransferase RsmD [Bacteroidales bacterium]|nr:16S rRNA (guanine(966)-N(2))-methyltransferase RsmD [Bacteroidales bacterium]MDD4602200.1 16S rRNA (guanine(966)-N(2))-methyltransferase RsmD [Bacteroidales bacterium]
MRIISGKYRGRKLQPPVSLPVRPTTDFAKEGLFNILANFIDFESIRVLDLFAGTGSIAFEFLSRGAQDVMAVDANHHCVEFIKKCATEFGATNLKALRSNAFVFLKHPWSAYDIIFADPPYDLEGIESIPDLVMEQDVLTEKGLLILEHSARYKFEKHPDFSQTRAYGNVHFTFFTKSKSKIRN